MEFDVTIKTVKTHRVVDESPESAVEQVLDALREEDSDLRTVDMERIVKGVKEVTNDE